MAYDNFIARLEAYQPGDAIITIGSLQIDLDPLIQSLQNFFLPAPETDEGTSEQTGIFADVTIQDIVNGIANIAGGTVEVAASIFTTVAGFRGVMFLAYVISLLTLLDLHRTRGFLSKSVPPKYHRETRMLLGKIDQIWLSFIKGQIIIGGLLGILSYIQFTLMGVPGALPLAIQNAFVSLIPNVGGILSFIPVAIVCLLGGSTVFTEMSNVTFTLLVGLISMLYSQFIYTFVAPVVVGKSVNLPVVLVIVGIMIGFALAGILGAFLVVPILSTIRLLVEHVLAKVTLRDPYPDEAIDKLPTHGFFSQFFLRQ
jgi:predicted PurR-regulated permease PerM